MGGRVGRENGFLINQSTNGREIDEGSTDGKSGGKELRD